MKLTAVVLKNFRSYRHQTRVPISDLTALIGRNDAGKSTILEALEIFFNNSLVKIDKSDLNIEAAAADDTFVSIGCCFEPVVGGVVIDAAAETNLADEYLLNQHGEIEIHQVFDCSKSTLKASYQAHANHPTADHAADLLYLKQQQLRARIAELGIPNDVVNRGSNVSMRAAIRESVGELNLQPTLIDLDKSDDAKKLWAALKPNLPLFALFQADRPSKDQDPEAQDPIKIAMREALQGVAERLTEIEEEIKRQTLEVARRTREKLEEMAPHLAEEITPHFKEAPKWEKAFSFNLVGENAVPLNKRGSGARRLILINFFRAEAERKRQQSNAPRVIYAIEEPETSQHPDHQQLLIKALMELSETANAQVLLTTHVPALASLLPTDAVRFITQDDDGAAGVEVGEASPDDDDNLLDRVTAALGILPDNEVKVFFCLEGPNDIEFFTQLTGTLVDEGVDVVDLRTDRSIAFLPLGGSTLKQWVEKRWLRHLNRPEVHVYDRDDAANPPYQPRCDQINDRNDDSCASLTSKRTLENYLHPDAIQEAMGVTVTFNDEDNVPEIVAAAVHAASNPPTPWDQLEELKREKKRSRAKRRLNSEAAACMTSARLAETDPNGDILNWLAEVAQRARE